MFFLKDRSAFSSTRDNEAGCAVTSFSAFNLAASSGIVMSDSTSTPLEQGRQIRRQFTAARLPPLLRRLR